MAGEEHTHRVVVDREHEHRVLVLFDIRCFGDLLDFCRVLAPVLDQFIRCIVYVVVELVPIVQPRERRFFEVSSV